MTLLIATDPSRQSAYPHQMDCGVRARGRSCDAPLTLGRTPIAHGQSRAVRETAVGSHNAAKTAGRPQRRYGGEYSVPAQLLWLSTVVGADGWLAGTAYWVSRVLKYLLLGYY